MPPFYAPDQMLSLFLAAVMGFQHALAMVGAPPPSNPLSPPPPLSPPTCLIATALALMSTSRSEPCKPHGAHIACTDALPLQALGQCC